METAFSVGSHRPDRVAIFRQLLTSATREASVAMSRWVGDVIDLTLEEVRAVPLEEVCTTLDLSEKVSILVVLTLRAPLGGQIILHFDEPNARALAKALIATGEHSSGGWSELEQSALLETGNILGCAYVNALSRMIDHELIPSAPVLVCDFAECVLEQALAEQLQYSDVVVVSRTRFTQGERNLNWWVLFLPGSQLQELMDQSLRVALPRPR